MKPVQILILVVAGALGGAVLTKVWQRPQPCAGRPPCGGRRSRAAGRAARRSRPLRRSSRPPVRAAGRSRAGATAARREAVAREPAAAPRRSAVVKPRPRCRVVRTPPRRQIPGRSSSTARVEPRTSGARACADRPSAKLPSQPPPRAPSRSM